MLKETTAQRKIAQLRNRYRVVQGGTSSSKTFTIIPMLIHYALEVPNSEISIVSESYPHLRRGALKDFVKIMEWTGNFNPAQFNKSDSKYKFNNGSYIEFFSATDESKLRGARRHCLFVNEANNIDWESFYQLAIRTSQFIYIDYNPTSEFWAHTELIGQPDTDFIILTYKDNEALDENIRKEIEKAREKAKTSEYWENWWKVYGLGETGIQQGVVFNNWKQIDKIPHEAKLLGYGLDFGYNDPSVLVAAYKYNGQYIFNEVIYEVELSPSELSKVMATANVDKRQMIYCDESSPMVIKDLSRMGWKAVSAPKGKNSILFGIEKMQENEFLVTSQSINMIKELRNYTWQKTKDGKAIDVPIDAFNHSIDATRYFMTSQVTKPTGKYRGGVI